MALKRVLRSGVAAACIASVAAPAGIAAPAVKAVASGVGTDVRVATTETFSRIEVGRGGALKREGQTVVLTVGRDGDADIGRLLTSPPKWIKSAVRLPVAGKTRIVITLAENADATIGQADGAVFANFFEKPAPAAAPAAAEVAVAEPEPPRPNPLPPGGVVKMASKVAAGQTQLTFDWANPAGAAVFRRGDAVWVVFDAPATLDVSSAPKNVRPLRGVRTFKGADHAALRIDVDPDAPVFVVSQGASWTISLGPGPQSQPNIVRVARDAGGGPAALRAPVAGATRVINLPDPVVGDTLTVVTALGPPKGVPSRRDYVDAVLLPSIQGLAVEPLADNVVVRRDGELVRISRDQGLTLSPVWATRDREDTQLGSPQPAIMPAIIPTAWAEVGSQGFLHRYESLLSAAAAESGNKDREAPVAARMGLARFLVGSELSFEAIGVLNSLAREHQEMLDDPEFRALRGVARTLARRYAEADADFSSPALADDPSTALWRAYVNTQIAQYPEARAQFAKGAEAYGLMPPLWKSRFARADAQSALAQGDLAGAEARIRMALEEKVSSEEQLRTRLVQARIVELQGFQDRALRIYKAIATAPIDSISAPATLRATQIRLQLNQITPFRRPGSSTACATAGVATPRNLRRSARLASSTSPRAAIARRWKRCGLPGCACPASRRPSNSRPT